MLHPSPEGFQHDTLEVVFKSWQKGGAASALPADGGKKEKAGGSGDPPLHEADGKTR